MSSATALPMRCGAYPHVGVFKNEALISSTVSVNMRVKTLEISYA